MMYLTKYGEVPKRLKGLASNTSRSVAPARGFKSLLLRFFIAKSKTGRILNFHDTVLSCFLLSVLNVFL